MKHLLLVLAGGLSLACFAGALQPSLPPFQCATMDGKNLVGAVQELTSQGGVRLAGTKALVGPGQWVTLRREGVPLPARSQGPQVVFANGDSILLADNAAVRLVDGSLRVEAKPNFRAKEKMLTLPLSAVAVLWLAAPDGTDDAALYLRQLAATQPRQDLVLLRQGDRVEGRIVALDNNSGCQLAVGTQQVKVPWTSIGAVVIANGKPETKLSDAQKYHLILQNGCRLGLTEATMENGKGNLTGRTLFGSAIEVPWAQVTALEVRGGRVCYLSDMEPSKYEHVPFLGPSWPLVRDGSATGHALRLGESTFDKGLGTHAECRVSYHLDGAYHWFEACVGLDPDHGQRGRVKIRVLVDGKEQELGWNKELTARDQHLVLRVDVHNARELILEVLCGDLGDVQAHVNWADARLIRGQE